MPLTDDPGPLPTPTERVSLVAALVEAIELTAPEADLLSSALVAELDRVLAEIDAARVVPVPAEIDATGTSDVTAALNAFLASVPDGSEVAFPAGARYRCEGVVQFAGKSEVTVSGNGATIVADLARPPVAFAPAELAPNWPRHRVHVYVSDCQRIAIGGLNVRGPHTGGGIAEPAYVGALEAQHAYEVARCTDVRIEGCEASHVYGDGVYVGKSGDVYVSGCHVHHNGRQGMSVTSGSHIWFVGNRLDQIRRTVFDLEPSTATNRVSGVLIADNVVGAARLNFLSSHGRGSVGDVIVRDNRLDGMSLKVDVFPPVGKRRSGFTITGNVARVGFGSTQAPIRFTRCDGILVEGNTQALAANRNMTAVSTVECCDVEVRDNSFPGAARVHVGTPGPGCA